MIFKFGKIEIRRTFFGRCSYSLRRSYSPRLTVPCEIFADLIQRYSVREKNKAVNVELGQMKLSPITNIVFCNKYMYYHLITNNKKLNFENSAKLPIMYPKIKK